MPFESTKQRKFLWAKKPDVAKKFSKHTPKRKNGQPAFPKIKY